MTINVTPFDVRHSGFTGGAINAVTKSGTNNWHVSVYDYFTNNGLTGSKFGKKDEFGNYPDRLAIAKSLDNTVGVSVGGPIVKDKLFFFVNFEYQSDVDPGQTHFARNSEDDEFGGATQYNRPTVEKMEEISNYLQKTYGYNPGRYQNYSASTPDYKLLARLDWNITDKDKFNIRYSMVKNKYSSTPSSSINPLSSSVYNRNIRLSVAVLREKREDFEMSPLVLPLSTDQLTRGDTMKPTAQITTTVDRMIRPFLFFMV